VQVFGYAILANLVVVVNHWSMSEDASKTRESVDISRESMYFLPPFLSQIVYFLYRVHRGMD
jgi:hypothetical protein